MNKLTLEPGSSIDSMVAMFTPAATDTINLSFDTFGAISRRTEGMICGLTARNNTSESSAMDLLLGAARTLSSVNRDRQNLLTSVASMFSVRTIPLDEKPFIIADAI